MVDSTAKGDEAPSLSGTTVKYMAKRVLTEFLRDGGTDQAAKLTYFMVLSIAPTLLALFSLATLLLSGIKDQIADLIKEAISSGAGGSGMEVGGAVDSTLDSLMGSATGGTVALIIGIATALWSASAYIKAYGRVANHIYEVPEGRGPIRMNGTMLALTVAMILGILLVMVSVLLSESIVDGLLGPIASTIGAEGVLSFLLDSFLPIWAWAKWPVILLLAFALISLLYWGAPNIKKPFRFISPGGVFAILGIAVAAVVLIITFGSFVAAGLPLLAEAEQGGGGLGDGRRLRPQRLLDLAVRVQQPEVAVDPTEVPGGHAQAAQDARRRVAGDADGPGGLPDPVRVEPLARLGGGTPLEDRVLPHRVGEPPLVGEPDHPEVDVLEDAGGVQQVGHLVDEVIQHGH